MQEWFWFLTLYIVFKFWGLHCNTSKTWCNCLDYFLHIVPYMAKFIRYTIIIINFLSQAFRWSTLVRYAYANILCTKSCMLYIIQQYIQTIIIAIIPRMDVSSDTKVYLHVVINPYEMAFHWYWWSVILAIWMLITICAHALR